MTAPPMASSAIPPPLSVSAQKRMALAIADANWFTTENLFRELDRPGVDTLLLNCSDYYNAIRQGTPPWSWRKKLTREGPNLWRRRHILPSGWMKRFPEWGMRPISRSIEEWRGQHASNAELTLVFTYPHYLYLRDQVRPDRHVYFNIDDYSQYWPRCARRVDELERQAVREADLTVCVSRARADFLRKGVPEACNRIRHLPHGAPFAILNETPAFCPVEPPKELRGATRPILGYVGTLEDRVDWSLLTDLADSARDATIVLIGKIPRLGRKPWQVDARRCLSRPNVRALGWRSQSLIGQYMRSFDVCLIPYRADHPFNRVCCPTKIMDYLATGRPIVSTALPECRLHNDLIAVANDRSGFLHAVRSFRVEEDSGGPARVSFAREHSCRNVADRFLDWLSADSI